MLQILNSQKRKLTLLFSDGVISRVYRTVLAIAAIPFRAVPNKYGIQNKATTLSCAENNKVLYMLYANVNASIRRCKELI